MILPVPVEQATWTVVTLDEALPLPLTTVQVCGGLEGGVEMETL
jgi:hypothetical protein